MSKAHSTTSTPPAKPSPDFPLFVVWDHKRGTGRWAKKIRGKLHYFGTVEDGPDAALKRYLDNKDDLHAGRTPADQSEAMTVLRLTVKFLTTKRVMHERGDLSIHSLTDYRATCKRLVKSFGKDRLVVDLRPDDFEKLAAKMSKTWGAVRLGNEITRVRTVFGYATMQGLIDKPVVFGVAFKRPSKQTMQKHRNEQGPRMFQADEIRSMLDAGQPLRAMILLGINCGFGNSDVGNLPLSALDLDHGWLNYPRPKTGIARRCPLWPETVQALRDWLAIRPTPKNEKLAGLVFLTPAGRTWAKVGSDSPVSREMKKLLDKIGVNGHRNFYGLRHSFQNAGDESRDFVAVRSIMGHTMSGDIASNYRDKPSDERLRAVANHVRGWLFAKPTKATKPKAKANPANLRLFTA